MFTEKHILGNPYDNHQLSRTVTGYEVTTVDCSADKSSGWNGATVNLEPTPAWNQKFSGWGITGGTLTGSAFKLVDDTTAQAKFETAKNVTLQTDGNGTINSTKRSGFINDTATLSNVPAAGYSFSGYTITGSILTGSNFKFTGSNITAKAWFNDPYNPLNLPANTIRLKTTTAFSANTSYFTSAYVSGDTTSKVYDLTRTNNNWDNPSTNPLQTFNHYAVYEVMGGNTKNVTSMSGLFINCSNMLKATVFNTTNVTSTESMFLGCNKLSSVGFYDTSNVKYTTQMFGNCSKLSSVPLYDLHNVIETYAMFQSCTGLQSIPLFRTDSLKRCQYWFYDCKYVTGGISALYNQMTAQTTPPTTYTQCFKNAGVSSTHGAAELALVPAAWK